MNIHDLYILYLRKSREDMERERQTGEDVLQTHRERLTDLAKARGFEWNEFAEVESGDTIAGRPVFRNIITNEIPSGKYRGIIINDISRLGRGDMEDAGIIYKTILRYNLLLITPHKTYDPQNRADLRQIRFELFLSREEFELIRERLNDGKDHKAKQGYAPNYLPILGFNTVRGKFILIPEEAALVKEIFEMRGYERKGYGEIAEILNSRGLRTKKGTKYHHSTIVKIINNKRYIGKAVWRGELFASKSPAIIPLELWNLVHDEVNPARTVLKRTSHEDSPYFVDLYCHHCSNRMYGEWVTINRLMKSGHKKNYNEYGIYVCIGRKRPDKCRHQQRIIYVHKNVLTELRSFIQDKKLLKDLAAERENSIAQENQVIEQKIVDTKRRILEMDKFLYRLDEDYRKNDLSAALYSKHYDDTIRQKEFFERQLKSYKSKAQKSCVIYEDVERLINKAHIALSKWESLSTPVKKIIISSFFPRIEIDREGTLFIKRTLPNLLQYNLK
ncbi:MAG: recombinase family protein [Bacillota bacterium]